MSILDAAEPSDSAAAAGSSGTLNDSGPRSGGSGVTASGRQSRAKGATPRELADMLARLLGGGSVLLAMWVEVEEAALTPDEASAIADPLSRIINRSNWGKRAAKAMLGADDYLALSLALFSYSMRIYPLVKAKMQEGPRVIRPEARPVRQASEQQPARQQQPVANSDSNGHSADASGGVRFTGSAGFGFDAD